MDNEYGLLNTDAFPYYRNTFLIRLNLKIDFDRVINQLNYKKALKAGLKKLFHSINGF